MKVNALLLLLVASLGQGIEPSGQGDAEAGGDLDKRPAADRAGESSDEAEVEPGRARRLELLKRAAKQYEIHIGPDRETKLALREEPVLRWSNPVRYSTDGATFLWTAEGRPQVAACIYSSTNRQGFVTLDHEFQSLSAGPLIARRNGQAVWFPTEAGVTLKVFPDAPMPAKTRILRLTQMRNLASEFTAISYDMRKTDHWRLRLLRQPLYRYGDEQGDPMDGALFVFVHGTDPDVIVLLEARQEGNSYRWHYGLARMCSHPLEVRRGEQIVWEVPVGTQPKPTKPYVTFYSNPAGE